MGRKIKKIDSKEVGLEAGLFVFKFFFKSEYLHYGYFKDGLEADVANLKKAQENYSDLLLDLIPEGVKTILDVGCGSGKMARTLLDHGYQVDCVSPSTILKEYAETLLKDEVRIFVKKFELLEAPGQYDLVLFSESFQYIPMDQALSNAIQCLKPGGHIIISDFFQRDDVPGKSPLGGGGKWSTWEEVRKNFPLELLHEQDITVETSQTMEIVNQLSMEVIKPIWHRLLLLAEDRFPLLLKFVRWKYKAKLDKIEHKHFQGERNAANFQKYKKYMVYLFQVKSQ